ncbi:hypothetical protein [Methylobacterium soli]|jgi:hypothetical protein|nr:hypothetical protein [Methylobacterium soli]GJE43871.1 hypothetical protein AEGHOMDF_3050 [Methylobacterium soli]
MMETLTVKRFTLAAIAALTLGTTLGAVEASAQYYGDDYGGRRYERRYDEDRYERRRAYDEDRYERRRDFGPPGGRRSSICVTARGNCVTRPAPYNSACGCEVPGFGFKRGQIGG